MRTLARRGGEEDEGLLTPQEVGADEAAVRKGHKYISAFCDLDKSRVVHVESEKDSSTVTRFKEWIQVRQRPNSPFLSEW